MKSTRKFYWFGGRKARRRAATLLCALLVAAWVGCTAGSSPRPTTDGSRSGGPDVRIVFASDLHGYLEPCGCQSRPLGGLDRAAVLVAEGRQAARGTLAILGGPTFFQHEQVEPDMVGQDRLRAETVGRILARLGAQAVVPGREDLALGADTLSSAAGDAVPLLVSNASAPAATRFVSEVVRRIGGVSVGIFGVTDLRPTVATTEPIAAARAAVARLEHADARVVIGVASLGRRDASRLAREVAGIDFLLVAGADTYPPPPPQTIGETVVLFGGRRGQGIGTLDLWVRERDPQFVDAGDQAATAAIERIDRRIADLETRLTEWQRSGGASKSDLATMRQRLADLRRERASLERRTPPVGQSSFVSRWEELGPERARDAPIQQIIDEYDRRVLEINRAALANEQVVPPEPGRPTYVGAAACADCHEQADRFWRTTKHSTAYATLERGGKQLDLSCVGCHVTGYRKPGGSTALHVGELSSVQCESCHGPGSVHVDETGADDPPTVVRQSPEATCLVCHNAEHSDQFNYRTYLRRILGPGHGAPVSSTTPAAPAPPRGSRP